ncbi:ABC transporter ATP-binding protein [Nocardioides sp. CFH 31398]|uniref:ABC transporter ATP-binding protein n=1 Tax=Nocardioides sp. CFH 31398 TaxID=2919579 RepID=UPI001F062418|nr:ABC transporter ATP-binding protein [Nocardioides sp. CFH 31398]MCH1867613.1 ABC transporter ATP-binding protein [Nocardioides sp. CFH 31398]
MTNTRDDLAVEVSGLRRSYGSGKDAFEAVRGLDLAVERGTITALLGTNGAGKTSTLEVIEGLAPATGGEVRVLGLDPVADRRRVRRRTGVLLQRSGFAADLTVAETLRMWGSTVTSPRSVAESLALLDLEHRADVRVSGLSGGEQRRLDLACTLMGHPELVFLDEPSTGLDPESRRRVWRLVEDLRDGGATVLLTTHYLEEAERLSDRISIMDAGRVVREGTPAEIVEGHPSHIEFENVGATLPPLPGASVEVGHARTVISASELQPALTALLTWADAQQVTLPGLVARTATLESVFLSIADQGHADPGAPADATTDHDLEVAR